MGIPGPASRVSTVPTMHVFLGLDCRASQAGSEGVVVLTPIVRPLVRRPPHLGRSHFGQLEDNFITLKGNVKVRILIRQVIHQNCSVETTFAFSLG